MSKKYIILSIIILFTMLTSTNIFSAEKTTGEHVNPFNPLMKPASGIDLVSGNAAFSHKLFELPGRQKMNISVSLNYSSNVYTNARAKNNKEAAGWCGLGWYLGYGTIISDHNGTMTYKDDQYWWLSTKGVKSRILIKYNTDGTETFYIEKNPYWKVKPTFETEEDAEFIIGWTLTSIDGKKYRYGDYNSTSSNFEWTGAGLGSQQATRYEFCWPNTEVQHVGNGFAGVPKLYPYQWDLSEIADVNGNTIKYNYNQKTEGVLSYGGWKSYQAGHPPYNENLNYTKASYISTITNPEGEKIEFYRTPKDDDEWYDRYDYGDDPGEEPDAFIEKFEQDLLDYILVYNSKSEIIRKFDFNYTKLNPLALESDPEDRKQHFTKSLLKEIREENGASPTSKLISKSTFTYHEDITKFNASDYHYGAIKTYKPSSGAEIEYKYKKQSIALPTYSEDIPKHWTGTTSDTYRWDAKGGSLSDGSHYFVRVPYKPGWPSETDNCNKVKVYNWDGGRWRKHEFPEEFEVNSLPYRISTGIDYFVLYLASNYGNRGESKQIWVYNWNGKEWIKTLGFNPDKSLEVKGKMTITCGKNSFFAAGSNSDGILGPHAYTPLVYAYNWDGKEWKLSNTLNGTDLEEPFYRMKQVSVKGNILTILSSNAFNSNSRHTTFVFKWDGTDWVNTGKDNNDLKSININNALTYIHRSSSIGNDFFSIHAQSRNAGPFTRFYNYAFHWDGERWRKTGDRLEGQTPFSGPNYFVTVPHLISTDPYSVQSNIYTWTGYDWAKRVLNNIGTPELPYGKLYGRYNSISVANDFFVGAFYKNSGKILVIGKSDIQPFPQSIDWPNDLKDIGTARGMTPHVGDNFYAIEQWNYEEVDSSLLFWDIKKKMFGEAGIWNGRSWKTISKAELGIETPHGDLIGAMFATNSCLGVLTPGGGSSQAPEPGKFYMFYKVQDQLGE